MKLDQKVVDGIRKGIESFPSMYIMESGRRVIACRLDDIKKQMRCNGWKNISNIDEIDCKESGLEVVSAYYGQRAHIAKRFCKVIVLREASASTDRKEMTSDEYIAALD
jgi:hypothetical protein